MEDEILLIMGEDGVFKEYKPYMELAIETKEDWEELQKAVGLWLDVKNGKAIVTYKEDETDEEAVH